MENYTVNMTDRRLSATAVLANGGDTVIYIATIIDRHILSGDCWNGIETAGIIVTMIDLRTSTQTTAIACGITTVSIIVTTAAQHMLTVLARTYGIVTFSPNLAIL